MKQITPCGPGLLIGIPTLGRPVSLEWALHYKGLNPPINYNTNAMIVYGKPVHIAREEICEEALKQGQKYVFFLGDDVVPPMAALKQLIFRAENTKDAGVVGGVYCSKCDPPAPLIFKENGRGSYWDWKVGEFFQCSGLGMDCTLIRTDVLQQMSKPWFLTRDEDNFKDGVDSAVMWTEDLYFCEKLLRETDFKVYVDTEVLCKHQDVYANKSYSLPANSLPLRRFNFEKKLKAIDIGCGPIDRSDEFPHHSLVRVDIRDECDPDYRCDVKNLPFEKESFDLVFSSHVLEHFPRSEWESVLAEWIRLLKPSGELFLVLPNIKWAVEEIKKTNYNLNDVLNVFYGAQSNPYDFHYNGLWPERMEQTLRKFGFKKFSFEFQGYNMLIRAKRFD